MSLCSHSEEERSTAGDGESSLCLSASASQGLEVAPDINGEMIDSSVRIKRRVDRGDSSIIMPPCPPALGSGKEFCRIF